MVLIKESQIYHLRRGIGPSPKLLLGTVIKSKKWLSHFFLNSTFSLNQVKFHFFSLSEGFGFYKHPKITVKDGLNLDCSYFSDSVRDIILNAL